MLSTYSRLLIDPNRGLDDPTLVMRYSDGAIVPGNAYIDAAEIARRSARFWAPYRQEIAATVDAMMATGEPPALISIHSFTPVWRGFSPSVEDRAPVGSRRADSETADRSAARGTGSSR